MRLISIYVFTQFYSVAIFDWEKRMHRQDFGFYRMWRILFAIGLESKWMKSKSCGWDIKILHFFCAGDFDPMRLVCFCGRPKPPHDALSLPCVHWKQSFFLISLPERAGSTLLCYLRGETRGQQSGQENHMSTRNKQLFFFKWQWTKKLARHQ